MSASVTLRHDFNFWGSPGEAGCDLGSVQERL